MLSLIIWIGIAANQTAIATLLGGAEYAGVITVASTQLIIMSVISTQLGLLRRNFEFKKLFVVRVCTALVPLIVTVPLAIWLKTYWALVIGNICGLFCKCTNSVCIVHMVSQILLFMAYF
ncbi:MAG: oligosaccharide flippase family protein [Bacteroides cellulosilyticus]